MQSEARSRSSKKLLHADLGSSRSKEPSRPQKTKIRTIGPVTQPPLLLLTPATPSRTRQSCSCAGLRVGPSLPPHLPLPPPRLQPIKTRSQELSVCLSGGPAGSYPASVLAREGISVTVLESAKFPRYHVGESLIPSVRHYMRCIGADEKLATHGFANKVESQFLGRFTSVDAAVKQAGLWD
ncbi:hypothetical protein DFH08DRAFT_811417 [Mycena albidolilacea]|uniref:FAD-binding domain-containing protein n=1 Tax=Mycena albidolilacea TaxID=1033008 RepID=A0AAD7EPQ7_9AGAR|nr:hypothetical protein DFH08DRAFT_811417 [Mycena albidolilacea]